MRIGLSHLILGNLSCNEFFTQAASAGYDVVEVCMQKEGELMPGMSGDAARQIVGQAKQAGVDIVSMTLTHSDGNLLDSGPSRDEGIQDTVAGLEVAAAMGLDSTLHTLGELRPDLYYADAYRNAVDSLRELAPQAERLGVTIAIEFVWNGFLFSPVEVRRFLDEVASDRVGFYFDPGNMAVFQYPHHWVHAIGSGVKMMHMKDWRGGPQNGDWTALLEGEVDFPAIMAELRAIQYDGPLISEVEPKLASLEDTAATIQEIAKMGR